MKRAEPVAHSDEDTSDISAEEDEYDTDGGGGDADNDDDYDMSGVGDDSSEDGDDYENTVGDNAVDTDEGGDVKDMAGDEVDVDEGGNDEDKPQDNSNKDDSDDEGGGSGYDNDGEDSDHDNKSGLANVMAKILATKKSENIILSKAKKDWDIKNEGEPEKDRFEVVDKSGKIKKEPKIKIEIKKEPEYISAHKRELMRKAWEQRFRVKPDLQKDHEKERKLKIIATQGVVQLFSAIEKHKTMLQKKLSETRSIMGREKIMETTGKEAFMEVLREQGKKFKRQDGDAVKSEDEIKTELKEEPIDIPVAKKPKWNVLADNFYKEPTLQGWDQQSDSD